MTWTEWAEKAFQREASKPRFEWQDGGRDSISAEATRQGLTCEIVQMFFSPGTWFLNDHTEASSTSRTASGQNSMSLQFVLGV
jgi:hypothetical protein